MTLTPEQIDIIDACKVAIVVTNGRDGLPQVTATWFERDGDDIRVSIAERGVKAANLLRDPRGTLFFLDPATSLRSVELRGEMFVSQDPGMAAARRIGDKYGDDLTQYVAEGEGRLTVTIRPEHVVVFDATQFGG